MAKKTFWNITYEKIGLTLLLIIASILRFAYLDQKIIFIGDFAWFYLSARDMILTGNIPLVGIASSHPWIHQGAFWTYLLAPALWIGNFHPVSGAYLAAGIGVVTVGLLYIIAKDIWGKHVAFFAAFFYAVSPLVVIHARMPYHTAPIPLFVLLYFYSVYKWLNGSPWYFPLSLLCISILYNFQLATSALIGPLIILFFYGLLKKQRYVTNLKNKKIIGGAILFFLLPLVPMILYDIQHYWGQTVGYVAWVGYRVLLLFGYPSLHPEIVQPHISDLIPFLFTSQNLFYYAPNSIVSLLIFGGSILMLLTYYKKTAHVLLAFFFFIPFGALVISKIPSDAYLPMLFVQLALILGIFIDSLRGVSPFRNAFIYVVFISFCFVNILTIYNTTFFIGKGELHGETYLSKIQAAKKIIQMANGKPYRIVLSPKNNDFASFIMPYEYLLWWMGKPTDNKATQIFEIEETSKAIHIIRQN